MTTRYAPYTDALDAIVTGETEGHDSEEAVIAAARAYVDTGLLNSTGSIQRFVRDVIDTYGIEALDLFS